MQSIHTLFFFHFLGKIYTMKIIFLLLGFFLGYTASQTRYKCVPRSYSFSSVVCVCNATYCDNIPQPPIIPKNRYISYTSTQSGLRFEMAQGKLRNGTTNRPADTVITIHSRTKFQTIMGWGGSFTDSTGININSLNPTAADFLLRSYFSKDGLEYNLCRVPIGGTDFSTRGYSYNDGTPDPLLLRFSLTAEDFELKIPIIKAAKKLTNTLELFSSAWTAPKWMKHNGEYTGPDTLRRSMYRPWANYFIKFLKAYKNEGIEFWGITTGNEPLTGLTPSTINSVGWLPWQLGVWIAHYLGPMLRNSEFSTIKLIAIDDQIVFFPLYIEEMFEIANAKEYVDGFGLHWYLNDKYPHSLLSITQFMYRDKFILATEACEGSRPMQAHVLLGEWERAESYALDIIRDLNNWVTGWVDWNMALDQDGGPTYIDNYVDSPIIVNASGGEFYKQPMFYSLGHFSKFIPKGSKRVRAKQSDNKVDFVALFRPDNQTVVVVLNSDIVEVSIKIIDNDKRELTGVLPPKSIVTYLYN